jgi:hypothetical protein
MGTVIVVEARSGSAGTSCLGVPASYTLRPEKHLGPGVNIIGISLDIYTSFLINYLMASSGCVLASCALVSWRLHWPGAPAITSRMVVGSTMC